MKSTGLGKGLSAVFNQNSIDEFEKNIDVSKYNVEFIKFDDIKPNKLQPRKKFDAESLETLAQSIKRNGIIQPLLVRKLEKGYEIIAGERRYRASKIANLKDLPCIVIQSTDIKRYEISLVENLHRKQLSALEEANAYKHFVEHYGITQQEMSEITGKSRSYITNSLRLLSLEPEVKEMLESGNLNVGHCKELLKLKETLQIEIANRVVSESLSVRQLEKLIDQYLNPKRSGEKQATKSSILSPETQVLKENMMDKLGTKVNFKINEKAGNYKGKIEIEFFSQEEFDRIIDLII